MPLHIRVSYRQRTHIPHCQPLGVADNWKVFRQEFALRLPQPMYQIYQHMTCEHMLGERDQDWEEGLEHHIY